MGAEIIRAKYDELENIAKKFGQQTHLTSETLKKVQQKVHQLHDKGWVGHGAESFFAEMDREVFPATKRLVAALEQARKVTLEVEQIIRTAEEEAARLFKGGPGEATINKMTSSSSNESPKSLIKPIQNGKVPLYMLDLDDPKSDAKAKAFMRDIDTQGRPVIFMIHGILNNDTEARKGYKGAADEYSKLYKNLPENKRPIIIGVDWNAGDNGKLAIGASTILGGGIVGVGAGAISYHKYNQSAIDTGKRFGGLLEQFNRDHPESRVDVVAHSLGNRMFMESVRNNDVQVNRYLAVEAAVERNEISSGGRFKDVLDTNEIGHMGATYSHNDRALQAHEIAGYRPALGNDATKVKGREITTYDMSKHDKKWTGLNHYNYNDAPVMKIQEGFFGKNGENL